MRKILYHDYVQLDDKAFLYVNHLVDRYIILGAIAHHLYQEGRLAELQLNFPNIYQKMCEGLFLVPVDFDEYKAYEDLLRKQMEDRTCYHLVINPTLDCNLHCWYCYEKRIPRSRMSKGTQELIIRHIKYVYENSPYDTLRLSFFGGEPFMRFDVMKSLILEIERYCSENGIALDLDFTTNATLCTPRKLKFLSSYRCSFQITLDGNKEQHNQIKCIKNKVVDTFALSIRNIHKIQEIIPNSHVWVRINYDQDTLSDFDSILKEIVDLDRRRASIILRRVWQVDFKKIDPQVIKNTIQKLEENDFMVDYYAKGGVCFADREHQLVINYDGQIFKCTTISDFSEENTVGTLDPNTGQALWGNKKDLYKMGERPERCKKCNVLPLCGGVCSLKSHKEENYRCFFEGLELSKSEYIIAQVNRNLLHRKIYNQ